MARPKKNNADYFSHESEMRNDVKIKALRRKFSHTGYAVWNYLLEVLTDAEGFAIRWEELDIELYAADFDLDTNELTDIVDYCIKLGLLQLSGNMLFCNNLTSSFEGLMNKRGRAIKAADSPNPIVSASETPQKESFCDRNPANSGVSASEIDIVEKSKVEYSKVNYSSPRTREGASAPSEEEKDEFYKIFFWRNLKSPTQELQRFLSHNTQYGWKLNNTPEKRREAALNWAPESNGDRVSKNFLAAWREIYKKLIGLEPAVAALMLTDDTKVSACNGALVLHAAPIVIDHIKEHRPPELTKLANGNPIRFSRIG